MYKIVLNPTSIDINDYTFGDAPQLEHSFEIFDKVSHEITYQFISYNSEEKRLSIPRGADIPYVERCVGAKSHINHCPDEFRKNSERVLIKHRPRDDKQVEAMKFLLGQDNYEYTKSSSQLLVALSTGAGKTYLAISYIAFNNLKSIIITASTNWLTQWKTRIQEHSNILSKEIYFIKGSVNIDSLLDKSSESLDSKYKVYLVTHSTLLSYANSNGWDKIRKLFIHLGIGVKIFDEAHLNFQNMSNIDYNTGTYKTVYLTATPARGNDSEDAIFQIYFKNVPKIFLYDPENDPHTNYIALRYTSKMSPREISKCINKYGFNKMLYCDKLIHKPAFGKICHIVFDLISNMNGKKLIFLATNNAVSYMYAWILHNYPEYYGQVGVFTSINPEKEKALQCQIILTTTKSAGAAVDIPGLICSVNLAEPTRSKPQNQQRFGRTRDYNTYYIDVIDDTSKITVKYYTLNLPMFETYALSTKEIRFSERELNANANAIIERHKNQSYSPFKKLK